MEGTTTTASPQAVEGKLDGWSLAFGILLVFSGMFAIMSPVPTTYLTAIFFGWFLLFGGIMQFIGAIMDRKNGKVWLGMFLGVLAFVLGLMMISKVIVSIVTITVFLGVLFLVDGVSKSIMSVATRPAHWGWMLTSGLISILLAFMVLTKVLVASALLIGTLVGIYAVFAGMEIIVMYYATKK